MLHPNSFLLSMLFITLATLGNSYLPAMWAMPTEFLSKSAAAAAVGMINGVGSIAGFAGPYLFGYINTKAGSTAIGMAMLVVTTLSAALLVLNDSQESTLNTAPNTFTPPDENARAKCTR